MDLVADNATNRLVKTLFTLSTKYGDTLNFTHQEIAEMSGISTETATRIMTQLKNASILEVARGRVIIKDKDKLIT
jgi:CRP-like cAMP-binding protein